MIIDFYRGIVRLIKTFSTTFEADKTNSLDYFNRIFNIAIARDGVLLWDDISKIDLFDYLKQIYKDTRFTQYPVMFLFYNKLINEIILLYTINATNIKILINTSIKHITDMQSISSTFSSEINEILKKALQENEDCYLSYHKNNNNIESNENKINLHNINKKLKLLNIKN